MKFETRGKGLSPPIFWTLPDKGKFFVSVNAAAFRILLPASLESLLPEMATAIDGVAISRGPWPEANKPEGFEFLFDDGSPSPFTLHALPESLDRLPAKSDEGRGDLMCLVYIGRESNPVEALAFSAGYRRVPKIPWLKPLKRRMR